MRYFSGIFIVTSFTLLLFGGQTVILSLSLNQAKYVGSARVLVSLGYWIGLNILI